jgi:signal transduction histidine kinase
MTDLIEDMLDVSRIESGRMELRREPVDLAELIDQALRLHQHTATLKKIRLSQQAEPGTVIHIDRRKILQVIDNLTSNAIKYSPEGSEIMLILKPERKALALQVIDQGCGIEPADQDRIFKAFGRAERNETTGGESSTGLGLFISRSIIDAHGGRLVVDSEAGCGSTFTMELPAQ